MTRPFTPAELDDYASGALPEPEAEALEVALFEAAVRGQAPATEYLSLRDGIAHLCRRGTFGVTFTEQTVQRFRSSGLNIAYLDVDTKEKVAVSRSAEVLLLRFALDLRDVERLDIEMSAGGKLVKTIEDVPFEPNDGAIYMVCEAELALEAGETDVEHRFVAVSGKTRRVVREVRVKDAPFTVVE